MRRRAWIVGGLAATGALVVGWGLMPMRSRKGNPETMAAQGGEVGLNGWIKIASDGAVVVAMARSEMGQGVHTALPMLVAEELDVPLSRIRIEQAGHDTIYANVEMFVGGLPLHPSNAASASSRGARWVVGKLARELGVNATGGSSSVADAWQPLRQAAGLARGSLLGAASLAWKLPVNELTVKDGLISHPSGRSGNFAEFAKAAALTPPATTAVKSAKDWKLIGSSAPRADLADKVFGVAQFGIDVRVKGMLYAAVRMAPALGGQPARLDAAAAMGMKGVLRVVSLPAAAGSTAGFAVVGTTSWHAKAGADAVNVDWQAPTAGLADSAQIRAELERLAALDEGFAFRNEGDFDAQWRGASANGEARPSGAGTRVEAHYFAPYLAHSTLEPMNCTAQVTDQGVEVWAPTQVPGMVRAIAARTAGVPESNVKVHVTLLGGGFGRRLEVDFVAQAVRVAMDCNGKAVQVLWSREQDMTHDFYRPAHACRALGVLDSKGLATAVGVSTAGDAITPRWFDRTSSVLAGPVDTPDKTTAEGLFDVPYSFAHHRVRHTATRSKVPVGFWRAVGHSHNAFFGECFVDEMAHAAKLDGVAFRRAHLIQSPRHLAVLNLAAEKAQWDKPIAGRARGVALHESFGTIVAQIVEISAHRGGLKVHRVTCAVDCGVVVNPGIVAQQMEGAVVFGLSAALYGNVQIKASRVQATNFPGQPILTMDMAPDVITHFIASDKHPSGAGEPGLPPIAPALANAWFLLKGERIRSMPFTVMLG